MKEIPCYRASAGKLVSQNVNLFSKFNILVALVKGTPVLETKLRLLSWVQYEVQLSYPDLSYILPKKWNGQM